MWGHQHGGTVGADRCSVAFFYSWGKRPQGPPVCSPGLWGEGLAVGTAFMGTRRVLVAAVSSVSQIPTQKVVRGWLDSVTQGVPAPLPST